MATTPELSTKNRLLAALSEADKAVIAPKLRRIQLDARMNIQKPDKPVEFAYFPESAIASFVGIGADGSRAEIGLIGRDGVTGLPILLGGKQSPHEIFIQAPGEGLRIAADDLYAAVNASESFRGLMLAYVQAFMTQMSCNALAGGRLRLESRLARWLIMCLDRINGDELQLTHEFISIMLGVRRPGVTLALQALESRGLIRNGRAYIQVIDREGLQESAEGFYGVPEQEYERLIG